MIHKFCKRCGQKFYPLPKDKTCPWCEEDRNAAVSVAIVGALFIALGVLLWWMT